MLKSNRIKVLIGLIFACCAGTCILSLVAAPSAEEQNATRTVEAQAKIDRQTKQAIESATEIAAQNKTATIIALTPTATPTPIPTSTRFVTPTPQPQALTIIEGVSSYGGFQVYPLPDRSSGRLFAAADTFTPHAAGRSTDGEWLFILYFDGDLQSGWVIRDSAAIPDADFNKLAVVDPDTLPALPELTYTESAARPFGVNASISQPTQQVQIQATAEPATSQTEVTQPTTPAANARPRNCTEARAMGLTAEEAGRWPHLDADDDGVACYGD